MKEGNCEVTGFEDDMPERAKQRDKKRRRRKYGMRVDGAGIRLLSKLIPKKKTRRG